MGSKTTSAFEQIANRFEIDFLETGLRLQPRNREALEALAFAYTRVGEFHKGLAIDRRLVALDPDNPLIHYNLACSLSLVGELDACFESLENAIALGYSDWRFLDVDEDLAAAREDPRFDHIRRIAGGDENE